MSSHILTRREYYCLKYEEPSDPQFYSGEYQGLPHLYLQEISAQRALAYFKRKAYTSPRRASTMKVVKVLITVEEARENE